MMSRLTTVNGAFRAHVLAARLTSEGFDVRLRGAIGSPYAVTMGDLALVDVLVPAEQVDDASYVLLVGEVDEVLEYDGPARRRIKPAARVVAGGLIALALLPLVHVVF
jgi:hypothetical protein